MEGYARTAQVSEEGLGASVLGERCLGFIWILSFVSLFQQVFLILDFLILYEHYTTGLQQQEVITGSCTEMGYIFKKDCKHHLLNLK